MRRTVLAPLVLALPLVALPFVGVGSAVADGAANANLTPVVNNGSSGEGTAMVKVTGGTIDFTLAASGLADGPHAAHIHFGQDARHECPTASDNNAAALEGETNEAEHFTTTEGAPAYGEIVVSLTTEGDTSPASGLAVDRFAVGDDFEYSRGDVQVTEELAQSILSGESVVVIHGVDYNNNGEYDFESAGKSELDPALPAEATDPASCGVLER